LAKTILTPGVGSLTEQLPNIDHCTVGTAIRVLHGKNVSVVYQGHWGALPFSSIFWFLVQVQSALSDDCAPEKYVHPQDYRSKGHSRQELENVQRDEQIHGPRRGIGVNADGVPTTQWVCILQCTLALPLKWSTASQKWTLKLYFTQVVARVATTLCVHLYCSVRVWQDPMRRRAPPSPSHPPGCRGLSR